MREQLETLKQQLGSDKQQAEQKLTEQAKLLAVTTAQKEKLQQELEQVQKHAALSSPSSHVC